jgi:hypothetical protein
LPTNKIVSRAVVISARGFDAATLARLMRQHHPAIVGRIDRGRYLLDGLAIADGELEVIAEAVATAIVSAE